MIYLLILVSLLLTIFTGWLLVRLHGAQRETSRRLREMGDSPMGQLLSKLAQQAIDSTLLPSASKNGLADVELRFREHQDPYRKALDLLIYLHQAHASAKPSEAPGIVKGIYQIQYTFDLSDELVNPCLELVTPLLMASSPSRVHPGRVERPTRGALLDRKTMLPLNNGTHVKQPLGVTVYDLEGKVLGKAKVLCC